MEDRRQWLPTWLGDSATPKYCTSIQASVRYTTSSLFVMALYHYLLICISIENYAIFDRFVNRHRSLQASETSLSYHRTTVRRLSEHQVRSKLDSYNSESDVKNICHHLISRGPNQLLHSVQTQISISTKFQASTNPTISQTT